MAAPLDSDSIATFDLAGDLDLEAQLTLTESKLEDTLKPPALGPHTLAADDPASMLLVEIASHQQIRKSLLQVIVSTPTANNPKNPTIKLTQ